MKISTLSELSLSQRIWVFVEVSFFYGMLDFIESNDITFAIVPDNTYRDGILFEILKNKTIPCFAGIDINGISIHKFVTSRDYTNHCRTPDSDLISKILANTHNMFKIEEYMDYRFSGKEKQHDVLRAFSAENIEVDKGWLQQKYSLEPRRKLVLVVAHIFCDAPHAYPNLLFQDYREWLIETCRHLAKNDEVEFLVKEHPSAALYNEEGVIDDILESCGFADKLLEKNVNTRSLFNSIDYLITCGGTAGMEFPCYGVPVLVGAKPPYALFNYVTAPDTLENYYQAIENIHAVQALSLQQMYEAKIVMYYIQCLTKISKVTIGMGSQDFYKGCEIDIENLYGELVESYEDSSSYVRLKHYLRNLLGYPYNNMIDSKELEHYEAQ